MAKDPQTVDFMNVDSFSQLPFIRPSPTTTAIRLFGIDVSPDTAPTTDTATTTESGRKFECHYCCRNFPTSQALGGHQNAHKRERQHAKRAHHHHHLYGYPSTNYNYYPTYNNNNNINNNSLVTSGSRFPGNYSLHRNNHQPTINGSPLAMWQIPATVQPHNLDRSMQPVRLYTSASTRLEYSGSKMVHRIENSGQVVGFDHNDQFNRRGSINHDQNVSLDLRL